MSDLLNRMAPENAAAKLSRIRGCNGPRSPLDPLDKAGRDFVPDDHRPQYAGITEEFTRAGARFLQGSVPHTRQRRIDRALPHNSVQLIHAPPSSQRNRFVESLAQRVLCERLPLPRRTHLGPRFSDAGQNAGLALIRARPKRGSSGRLPGRCRPCCVETRRVDMTGSFIDRSGGTVPRWRTLEGVKGVSFG